MLVEWNNYFNWEIEQWTKAIFAAIPSAKAIESTSPVIKDPKHKEAIFDALGKMNNG